jgi:hypothetical protein
MLFGLSKQVPMRLVWLCITQKFTNLIFGSFNLKNIDISSYVLSFFSLQRMFRQIWQKLSHLVFCLYTLNVKYNLKEDFATSLKVWRDRDGWQEQKFLWWRDKGSFINDVKHFFQYSTYNQYYSLYCLLIRYSLILGGQNVDFLATWADITN